MQKKEGGPVVKLRRPGGRKGSSPGSVGKANLLTEGTICGKSAEKKKNRKKHRNQIQEGPEEKKAIQKKESKKREVNRPKTNGPKRGGGAISQ